jgi:hypothetical protein
MSVCKDKQVCSWWKKDERGLVSKPEEEEEIIRFNLLAK